MIIIIASYKVCFVYIYGLFHYICKFKKILKFAKIVVTPFCFLKRGTNSKKQL